MTEPDSSPTITLTKEEETQLGLLVRTVARSCVLMRALMAMIKMDPDPLPDEHVPDIVKMLDTSLQAARIAAEAVSLFMTGKYTGDSPVVVEATANLKRSQLTEEQKRELFVSVVGDDLAELYDIAHPPSQDT